MKWIGRLLVATAGILLLQISWKVLVGVALLDLGQYLLDGKRVSR